MIKSKILSLYRITHKKLINGGWIVMSDSASSAIKTFMRYYAEDYRITEDEITGVILEKTIEMSVNDGCLIQKDE